MKFEILRASDHLDAQAWDALIDMIATQQRDIHFTSAYGRVQEKNGGESILAVLSEGGTFIAQPFIKRVTPFNTKWFDLCSPYGYGGPFANDHRFMSAWAKAFDARLHDWAIANSIVSEFCYLHPLMTDYQRELVVEHRHIVKDVVVIDLNTMSEETLARRVRRGLRKAIDDGATCTELQDQPIAHSRFAELYTRAMDKKNAAQRWLFSPEYLEAHYVELNARLFHASNDEMGVRMLMVIGGYGTAYAHFFGSNGLAMRSGLDELVYCHAAKVLKWDGYERFHLGGGLTGAQDDRLLAFKSGFSKQTYKLASYTRVFDEWSYAELTRRKLDDEIARYGAPLTSTFFPLYRRETA